MNANVTCRYARSAFTPLGDYVTEDVAFPIHLRAAPHERATAYTTNVPCLVAFVVVLTCLAVACVPLR